MPDGTVIDSTYLTIYAPWMRPLSFLGLELVVVGGGVLTFLHALRRFRAGDAGTLFSWFCIFAYGISIELLSYNLFKNFTHGQFTVMFYHRKLPLYVTAVYPVLLYSALQTVVRFGFSRFFEPIAVGLLVVAMDVPFDMLGPEAGWWSWAVDDTNVLHRFHGVPVTSYYWHLTWGAIVVALARTLHPKMAILAAPGPPSRYLRLFLAVPVGVATIVLGIIAFFPFHALSRLGVSHGLIVLGALVAALVVVGVAPRRQVAQSADPLLSIIPATFIGYHALVALVLGGDDIERLVVIFAAIAACVTANVFAHRRRAAPVRVPSA